MRGRERNRERELLCNITKKISLSLSLHSGGLASDSNQCLRCPHQPDYL